MLYKDAVGDLIGHLQKQIKTTNSEIKRQNRFHLPQIINKNLYQDCQKKINKTIEEQPIRYSKPKELTKTERLHIQMKHKQDSIKKVIEMEPLDECHVYVWKFPKVNIRSTRQQRIFSTIK